MAKQINSVESKSEEENSMPENLQSGNKVASKNRASRAGTRSVASLTPEQLARKRANDREAQRSIRLRTKTRIAFLEQRIRELSGDRDDRVIEAVCKRNLELEEELRYLRHLSEALGRPDNSGTTDSMVQGNWDDHQQQMAYLPNWNSRVPHEDTEVLTPFYGNGSSEELIPGYSSSTLGASRLNHHTTTNGHDGGAESMVSHTLPAPIPIPSRSLPSFNSRPDPLRSRSVPQSGSSTTPVPNSSSSGPQSDSNSNVAFTSYPPDRKIISSHSASNGAGSSSNYIGGNSGNGSNLIGIESNYGLSSSLPFLPQLNSAPCPWEISLHFHSPIDAVESMLLRCLQQQRTLSQQNKSATIKKSWRPSIKGLIYPELKDDSQSIDAMLLNSIKGMALRNLPEKVGFFCIVHWFLQWQSALDEETWGRLPQWIRPEPVQLSNRHPILASLIFWPTLRKTVIESQSRYFPISNHNQNLKQKASVTSFSSLYTKSLVISWPYPDTDVFTLSDTGDGDVHVSNAFLTHAQDLNNWSLASSFWYSWPELMSEWVGTQTRLI